jgi:hypothetical protein
MSNAARRADFSWDIDANIKARAEGSEPEKKLPKRKVVQAKPVGSRRKKWIWHYCQKCLTRGAFAPPEVIAVPMCGRCVALDTPHPHLHPDLWAKIKLADGIVKRRRRH